MNNEKQVEEKKEEQKNYPVTLEIDYVEKHNRLTTFFRIFLAIPVIFILFLLAKPVFGFEADNLDLNIGETIEKNMFKNFSLTAQDLSWNWDFFSEKSSGISSLWSAGIILLPTVLLILFCRAYPRWWFNWNLEFSRFSIRVLSYLLFLQDQYPSVEEEQSVHLDFQYPDAKTELNRWLPLIKWFLAIPHFIILSFLITAAGIVSIFAWFVIIITGKYPKVFFDFVVGVIRWNVRVNSYCLLMVTDKYPPFSF